jgi:hypothetical protein
MHNRVKGRIGIKIKDKFIRAENMGILSYISSHIPSSHIARCRTRK